LLFLHSRRLPGLSVAGANDVDQIIPEKHPATANLGAGDLLVLRAGPQRLWVDAQEFSGFVKV